MLNLALWLKANGFRADQVQNFYPTPMATATAMYYSESDPFTVLIETVRQYPLLDTEVSDAFTKRSCDTTIQTIGRCCDERCGG